MSQQICRVKLVSKEKTRVMIEGKWMEVNKIHHLPSNRIVMITEIGDDCLAYIEGLQGPLEIEKPLFLLPLGASQIRKQGHEPQQPPKQEDSNP